MTQLQADVYNSKSNFSHKLAAKIFHATVSFTLNTTIFKVILHISERWRNEYTWARIRSDIYYHKIARDRKSRDSYVTYFKTGPSVGNSAAFLVIHPRHRDNASFQTSYANIGALISDIFDAIPHEYWECLDDEGHSAHGAPSWTLTQHNMSMASCLLFSRLITGLGWVNRYNMEKSLPTQADGGHTGIGRRYTL